MRATPWITGLALGASAMYLLDPRSGGRRRALTRDKARHLIHKAGEAGAKTRRDLANRARGVAHDAAAVVRRDRPDDAVLRERVRAKLGRHVSHPSAIEVDCLGGNCTLSGKVLASEADGLTGAVAAVPGVANLIDQLERHESADGVPELQGGRERSDRPDLLQRNWPPATRLLAGMTAGAVGGALLLRRLANRSSGDSRLN